MLLLFFIFVFAYNLKAYKIGIAAVHGSLSHVKYLFEICSSLHDEGHEIYFLSTEDKQAYLRGYDYKFYKLDEHLDSLDELRRHFEAINSAKNVMKALSYELTQKLVVPYPYMFKKVNEFIKNIQPDLLICDFGFTACSDAARYQNTPSMVGFQPFIGSYFPEEPYLINHGVNAITTLNMNVYDKFKAKVIDYIKYKFNMDFVSKLNKARRKNGVPSYLVNDEELKTYIKIINNFPGFEPTRPLDPNNILVGPILKQPSKLPNKIKDFIDNHNKIAFIAFGTHNILPVEHVENILGAIELLINNKIIDGVIWATGLTPIERFRDEIFLKNKTISKYEYFNKMLSSVYITEKAPQSSILIEDNVKVFISHSGIESCYEGLYSGKPILSMPYFVDQPQNALKLKELTNSIRLNPRNTNSYQIYEGVKELISSDLKEARFAREVVLFNMNKKEIARKFIISYIKTSKICRTGSEKPYEKVLCENKPYINVGARMSFFKRNNVDLYVLISGILILGIGLIILVIQNIIKLLKRTVKIKLN